MKWTLEYLNQHGFEKDFIKKVSRLRDIEIYPVGSIYRMVMRGAKLPAYIVAKGEAFLKRQIAINHIDLDRETKPKPPKMRDFAEPVVENAVTVVDSTLKRIRNDKLKAITDAEMTWALKLTVSQAKAVVGEFQSCFEEFKEALGGKDQQLVEGYSHYTKKQMALAMTFLERTVSIKGIAPIVIPTKPKPKKSVMPDIIVKKVLYLPSDADNNVASINPEELVGAKELWTWNSRTNRLGVYVASGNDGLTVHRTTMMQHDAEASVMKVLRKPKTMLAQFQKLPDNRLKAFFNKITTVAKPMNDRLSRDIVLLKAIRMA